MESTKYKRCDPDTMVSKDEETCDEIECLVCNDEMDTEYEGYCNCNGLKKSKMLRGAFGRVRLSRIM
jgi:hypothetical protein